MKDKGFVEALVRSTTYQTWAEANMSIKKIYRDPKQGG